MLRITLCLLLLTLMWTGCSDDPVSPPELIVSEPLAIPLAVGNTWVHTLHREQHIFNEERTQELFDPTIQDAMSYKEIVGIETILDVEYMTEREVFVLDGIDSTVSWRRFRQDKDGFYRAKVRLGWAFGNLPPFESMDEFRRLSYPLAVDATWETNDGSRRATVEAVEDVETASGVTQAYRILVKSDDPEDMNWTRVWYGRCGLVRRHDHQGFFAHDAGNNTTVLFEIDLVEEIEAVTLEEDGCVFAPFTE